MGQIIKTDNVTSWNASGAITKDTIVVSNAAGVVITGANANDANIVGVAQHTVADGEGVAVAGPGDIVWVTAGAAITHGARLVVGDSSGRAIVCPEVGGTVYNIAGHAFGACSNAGEKVSMLVAIYTHKA